MARRFGVSPTTVQKWRKRETTADARMGPKEPRSTVLSSGEEAVIVAFRRHTLLALDDCLSALQPSIPHLTRSSPHCCLQRHGISRLPKIEGEKPTKKRFAAYPIGYFHIDLAEVRTGEGKLRLFVAIDRTSKSAFVRLVESAGKMEAAQFLRDLVEAVPYRIHTVLTDRAIEPPLVRGQWRGPCGPRRASRTSGTSATSSTGSAPSTASSTGSTPVNHPWSLEDQQKIQWIVCPTNGQVERMSRTPKDATVKRHHYDTHDQLRTHLQLFVDAYNHARRLKTPRGLTPYELICQAWTKDPNRSRLDPSHHIPGPYS